MRRFLLVGFLVGLSGCSSTVVRLTTKALLSSGREIEPVTLLPDPVLPKVRLSALWIGHASFLIQIDDRVIVTDPSLTPTVGMVSQRLVAPGIDPTRLNRVDATVISHLHFDHLSYGSLDMLPKDGLLVIPPGGAEYVPELGFSEMAEALAWNGITYRGLNITPVPVKHFGGRYGLEMRGATNGWTGYIIEYHGITVLFCGDTGYDEEMFKEIGRRFHIDLALIPIAPVEPRDFMKRVHADPAEALAIFNGVKARWMIPMHYATFEQGLDPSATSAIDTLRQLVAERGLQSSVVVLRQGERSVLLP